MVDVLRRLDTKWERKKLVWADDLEREPPLFNMLIKKHTPSAQLLIQAFSIRQQLYGAGRHNKNSTDMYASDTWT